MRVFAIYNWSDIIKFDFKFVSELDIYLGK